MAAIGGMVSRPGWQGLLRTVARARARAQARSQLELLGRTPRWISGEETARLNQPSTSLPQDVQSWDELVFKKTIDQASIPRYEQQVTLVDSKIECLCSWNEASADRSRQTIFVPGDASRPRKTPLSEDSGLAAGVPLAPAISNRRSGFCNPGRGPRNVFWDDCLAALYATDPDLKLDHVDVMVSDDDLLYLLLVAQNGRARFFGNPVRSPHAASLQLLLIGNTLVIQRHVRPSFIKRPYLPSSMPSYDWEYYQVATESVPEVGDSSVHFQLLRYNIGPISFLVRVKVNGTVQEMPTAPTTSDPEQEAQQPRTLHGVDVIKAGNGVDPASAFQAIARPIPAHFDGKRLKLLTPRIWLSGQTRLGVADVVPADQVKEMGGLTVLDVDNLVRQYEAVNQRGLRRLPGLVDALRDAVREHGAPCVATMDPPPVEEVPTTWPEYTMEVHPAPPYTDRILLDSHKSHFWSQDEVLPPEKKPDSSWTPWSTGFRALVQTRTQEVGPPGEGKQVETERKDIKKQARTKTKNIKAQPRPQGTASTEHVDTPKSFMRALAQKFGFGKETS